VRHLLILLSLLLLSSPVIGQETGVLYLWENGTKYMGECKDGKKHGQGTTTYSTGIKYVGEFKYDTTWKGTFYDINGNIVDRVVNGNWIKQYTP